jgi:hypothetical protein
VSRLGLLSAPTTSPVDHPEAIANVQLAPDGSPSNDVCQVKQTRTDQIGADGRFDCEYESCFRGADTTARSPVRPLGRSPRVECNIMHVDTMRVLCCLLVILWRRQAVGRQ